MFSISSERFWVRLGYAPVDANYLSVEEIHCSHIEGKYFSSFEVKNSWVDENH